MVPSTLFPIPHLFRFMRNIDTVSLESLCNIRLALVDLKTAGHLSPRDVDNLRRIDAEVNRRIEAARKELPSAGVDV